MASALAESPPAPAEGPPAPPVGKAPAPTPLERSCVNCGAELAPSQDWCLQCGAGAPGTIDAPGWRSAATVLTVVVVLALGAAAAAYAALSRESPRARTVTMTVAQATAPSSVPAVTPAPTVPAPSVKPSLPLIKAPKIPLTAVPLPKAAAPTTTVPQGSAGAKTTPSSSGGQESQPAAILLDTNAASTYNPYKYPESDFGDPSLTIDGDTTTGWTAIVEPASAPKMAEGVLIDLKTPHRLAALALFTAAPGLTVQVYGANAKTAPASITDPAWIPISRSQVLAKKHARIKLRSPKKGFSFVTVWISRAPAASVGTPAAPGHVTIDEIELFPAH